MRKAKAYILLGSNIGDKKKHIDDAQHLVQNHVGKIIAESALYISEAWGFESDEMFLNKVIVVESELDAFEILNRTQNIETSLGRTAKTTNVYQSRIIDIDILFYDDKIIETAHLTIPHKHMQNRLFTLMPLAEIAPDFIHPKLQKTLICLLQQCSDNKKVNLLQETINSDKLLANA
jgi:2-amino-4-hydroxy-6-hydroxymethyldihydropteridine diphosphokinase